MQQKRTHHQSLAVHHLAADGARLVYVCGCMILIDATQPVGSRHHAQRSIARGTVVEMNAEETTIFFEALPTVAERVSRPI